MNKEYYQKRYTENREHYKAVQKAWYYANKIRRSERMKRKHAETFRPKYRITVTDPDGMEHGFSFLTDACFSLSLPYGALRVRKYPFEYRGFNFKREEL